MTATQTKPSHIGVGLYTIPDAARIIGSPVGVIRQWCRTALIPHFLESEKLLTFAELMELHFIKMFRDEGVTLRTIKKASQKATAKFETACPFSVKRFDTDGRDIFATMKSERTGKVLAEDLARSQFVFEKIMKPFFRKLEYSANHDLLRFWPNAKRGRVVLDPSRKFGRPIDAETGVATHTIASALSAGGGQSPEDVARWLNIPLAAVNKAAEYERSLSA